MTDENRHAAAILLLLGAHQNLVNVVVRDILTGELPPVALGDACEAFDAVIDRHVKARQLIRVVPGSEVPRG